MRGCIRHHINRVKAVLQAAIYIGCILIVGNVFRMFRIEGIAIPAGRNGTFNGDGAIGTAVACHIGFLAQSDRCRQRIHVDGHRVGGGTAVRIRHGHNVRRGVGRSGHRCCSGRIVKIRRVRPCEGGHRHAAFNRSRQRNTLSFADGGVVLVDCHPQRVG